jgi:dihydroorotate dehydrogenase electron transfer subunit
MNQPKSIQIQNIIPEAKNIITITFKHTAEIQPGQFYMVWVPGIDEIPMSVSYIQAETKGITFRVIGDATKALARLKIGDKIGIRGPYGNGFKIHGKSILFIGGGTGVAMLAPTVEQVVAKKIAATVIIGVKTKDELFFDKRLRKAGAKVFITTDDGSFGVKGFASDLAQDLMKKEQYDSVITCGPELMMKTILNYCQNIDFQASLERYMKCAFGVCGQCCIGNGIRVCVDGPVFDKETLKKMHDFGVYRRDAAGRKIKF